jgi:hypothetical protein
MRGIALLSAFFLAACLPTPGADVAMNKTKASAASTMLIPNVTNRFGLAAAAPSRRSNAAIAQDFVELSFSLETGRAIC